jgi:hypothetical protein
VQLNVKLSSTEPAQNSERSFRFNRQAVGMGNSEKGGRGEESEGREHEDAALGARCAAGEQRLPMGWEASRW